MVIMTIFYLPIDQDEAFMVNKLLRNSISILLIVVSTITILKAAIYVIYILPFF